MVQFSHLYVPAGKTIALTIQTFVSKVMSSLFNTLSRLVIAFFLRKPDLSENEGGYLNFSFERIFLLS